MRRTRNDKVLGKFGKERNVDVGHDDLVDPADHFAEDVSALVVEVEKVVRLLADLDFLGVARKLEEKVPFAVVEEFEELLGAAQRIGLRPYQKQRILKPPRIGEDGVSVVVNDIFGCAFFELAPDKSL
eukprot:TRINITY_DN1423_c0_g1_i8.p3 TRINITY_DN1423_c0_g1~~TRINITY_DN1423_c0_g1_i8.p3  ORF type:complete len:128 (+),score=24.68 TRINITY_DN1423_c0_g1_i8:302-685(+)